MVSIFLFWIISILIIQDEYKQLRESMVEEQLISRGITDVDVLTAMRKVPRHAFVPYPYTNHAYDDRPLPIGYNQTISQPYMVAYMTQAIEPEITDTILEIGTGSGYQAAILSELCAMVYSIEIIEPLGHRAKELLRNLNYDNVEVIIGDGYNGLKNKAPFDAIIITAAPDEVPPALIDQLKNDGRMIVPVGREDQIQYLTLISKKDNKLISKKLIPVRFVPFTRSR